MDTRLSVQAAAITRRMGWKLSAATGPMRWPMKPSWCLRRRGREGGAEGFVMNAIIDDIVEIMDYGNI
jgi:hypothetical protein